MASSKGGANAVSDRGHGWVGLNLGGPAEGAVPNCKGACCLKRTVGKPDVRHFREGGWKRGLRWNCAPTRNRKGGTGQASTYGSARQCPTRPF